LSVRSKLVLQIYEPDSIKGTSMSHASKRVEVPDAFPSILEKRKSLATGTSGPSFHHLSPVNTCN
jgi:hypothetical protein